MSREIRSLEERLAQAARDGELAAPNLEGRPIADIGQHRPQGWWADRFVTRERSADRAQAAQEAAAAGRVGFWRADSVDDLRQLVAAANAAIEQANERLLSTDHLLLSDQADIAARWEALRRG